MSSTMKNIKRKVKQQEYITPVNLLQNLLKNPKRKEHPSYKTPDTNSFNSTLYTQKAV